MSRYGSYRVLGCTYEADLHCVDCTLDKFGQEVFFERIEDNEGNEVRPVYEFEQIPFEACCGTCLAEIS